MSAILVPIAILTLVVFLLAAVVQIARRLLVPARPVDVLVNGQQTLEAMTGDKLLWTLDSHGVHLPAACGGRGTCGQCRVEITHGARDLLPSEANHIGPVDAARGVRLACMVSVRENLVIRLPPQLLAVRQWQSRVRSNASLTTYLKELVLELPDEFEFNFEAGAYILVEAPEGHVPYEQFEIGEAYRDEWQARGLFKLVAHLDEPVRRAYSLANHPGERGVVRLVVRIALAPSDAPADTPPGRVSSWLFSLRAGDLVTLSGPFGEFCARGTEREMVLIGGGAGIAPLRSIVLDQLLDKRSTRQLSFWYGARNAGELCYHELFEQLAAEHSNFHYQAALSDPDTDPNWSGPRGFVHAVAYALYLHDHPHPEEVEYYLCGPPLMSSAVLTMLEDLGVDRANVLFDDFGT